MMGPLSTAVAIGCLLALRWLFWLTAALIVFLVIKKAVNDEFIDIGLAIAAVAFVALGWLSGLAVKLILKAQEE
jgi:hypothetical protein